jgi:hypothetical protein
MALALALPVFLLVLMSNALSLTVNELPIVVQDFDGSTASNDFIDVFRASITLHVVHGRWTRQPRRPLPPMRLEPYSSSHSTLVETWHGASTRLSNSWWMPPMQTPPS